MGDDCPKEIADVPRRSTCSYMRGTKADVAYQMSGGKDAGIVQSIIGTLHRHHRSLATVRTWRSRGAFTLPE